MLNMNERMNESLFNLNYKIINIVRLFNFTRSAILPHNLPKLYSTGRFSWSTICYCAGGRGLKVLNGTRPVEYTHWWSLKQKRGRFQKVISWPTLMVAETEDRKVPEGDQLAHINGRWNRREEGSRRRPTGPHWWSLKHIAPVSDQVIHGTIA